MPPTKRKKRQQFLNLEKEVKAAENNFKAKMSDDRESNFRCLGSDSASLKMATRLGVCWPTISRSRRHTVLSLQFGTNRVSYIRTKYVYVSTIDINNTFKESYENLYKSESQAEKTEVEAFLCDLDLPTLSTDQKHILDAPITTEEILEIIQSSPVGKAPGPDGFTA